MDPDSRVEPPFQGISDTKSNASHETLDAQEWTAALTTHLETVAQSSVAAMAALATRAPMVPTVKTPQAEKSITQLSGDLLGVISSLRDVCQFTASGITTLYQLQSLQQPDAADRYKSAVTAVTLEQVCGGAGLLVESLREALNRYAHVSHGELSQVAPPASMGEMRRATSLCLTQGSQLNCHSRQLSYHSDFDDIYWDDAFFEKEYQMEVAKRERLIQEEADHEHELRLLDRRKMMQELEYLPDNALILTVDAFFMEGSETGTRIGEMTCKQSSTKELVPPTIGQFCCGLESKEDIESGVLQPHPALVPMEGGDRRVAGNLLRTVMDRFDPVENCFDEFTIHERERITQDFRVVASAFITAHAGRDPVVFIDQPRAAYCGDLQGNFLGFHMIFMRTTPCGEYHHPFAGFIMMGGYSGKCSHCVELLLCALCLAVVHPSVVFLLRSRWDEEEATGDLEDPMSLRSRCRVFCESAPDGDALWRCISKAIRVAPVAAVVNGNIFAAHAAPGATTEVSSARMGLYPASGIAQRYSDCAANASLIPDFLSEFQLSILVSAGLPPAGKYDYKQHLIQSKVLHVSCCDSPFAVDGLPEVPQACGISSSRVLVFRWYPHHRAEMDDSSG